MKFKHAVGLVFLILLIDQIIKIYVKTHFYLGESYLFMGNKGQISFTENSGMAFGLQFGGNLGKLALTLFRLVASIAGFWFINHLIKTKNPSGLIFCASLILAGAIGNLLDSIFYGMIFTESNYHLNNVAKLVPWGKGYGTLLHGSVVDMFYFPIYHGTWPKWIPVWGGTDLEFFRPIFNFADAAISTGVISILVFQKWLLK